MKKILVLGTGTMGAGIAQVAAQAGYEVLLRSRSIDTVNKRIEGIGKALDRLVEKGKLEASAKEATMSRIKGITDIADGKDADLVVEAAVEDPAIKIQLFKDLGEMMKPEAILATNTSSLSITLIAAATNRPDKVIGLHFFNPVPAMALIEIIRGVATSDATYNAIMELAKAMGKTPVEVNEAPGFVVNRILFTMINEAILVLSEGVASAEDIDNAMKLGANHPLGPLALADLVGLDITLAIMETLYSEFSDSKYRPAPMLRKLVRAGYLGRKTGRGFYSYEKR